MNRKSFLKTLIGGVVSAPIAAHELQSQAIAIGAATPNYKLIVKSNNDSRTK